ncbi:arginine--tRNA ligase, partial [Candidatus Kaiserbacteria bacterium RIFCSPLOWO2_12_FULL_54_10]
MEEKIRKVVQEALAKVGAPGVSFAVEQPADMAHGDYATNAALAAAKQLGREPLELASELAGRIEYALGESTANVTVAGPGFVNITLAREAVTSALADAQGAEWGTPDSRLQTSAPRVIVEYSNPNAFKEMHIGHLVGTVVGEAVSRLIENSGA